MPSSRDLWWSFEASLAIGEEVIFEGTAYSKGVNTLFGETPRSALPALPVFSSLFCWTLSFPCLASRLFRKKRNQTIDLAPEATDGSGTYHKIQAVRQCNPPQVWWIWRLFLEEVIRILLLNGLLPDQNQAGVCSFTIAVFPV